VKRRRGENGFGEKEGERGAHLEKRVHKRRRGQTKRRMVHYFKERGITWCYRRNDLLGREKLKEKGTNPKEKGVHFKARLSRISRRKRLPNLR
jgi:hypothetical protein